MQAVKCDLCGSVDFKKEGDFFVCQYCRVKYTMEDARKMFEGQTIEVKGKVSIDQSEKEKNLMKLLEIAVKTEDNAKIKETCEKILEINAENWKAIALSLPFYVENENEMTVDIFKVLKNKMKFLFIQMEKENETSEILKEIVNKINPIMVKIYSKYVLAYPHYYGDEMNIILDNIKDIIDITEMLEIELEKVNIKDDEINNLIMKLLKNELFYLPVIAKTHIEYRARGFGDFIKVTYTKENKQVFIDKFNSALSKVRSVEPDYMPIEFIV